MRGKLGSIFIGVVGGALIVSLCTCRTRSVLSPNHDTQIRGPITLSDVWTDIALQSPPKITKQVNEIVVWFARRYSPDWKSNGLRFPDGTLVVPDVQLIAQDGQVYNLTLGGMDETGMTFRWHDSEGKPRELPMGATFTKLRIKSIKPIECSSIVWRSYNYSERK
jgi:hypothetical protein